jgi:phage-related protein
MDYANSVQTVLLRKIQKAEQDLVQLKLDYCRFIFGLTHRTRVVSGGNAYLVRSVDVDSMERQEDGTFTRPAISVASEGSTDETVLQGNDWEVEAPAAKGAG